MTSPAISWWWGWNFGIPTTPCVGKNRVADDSAQDWSPDELAVHDRGLDVVVTYATSMHASRLQHTAILRRLGVDGTARNWRTVQALTRLACGH
jgi:uncharacterized protein (DUF1697 family)